MDQVPTGLFSRAPQAMANVMNCGDVQRWGRLLVTIGSIAEIYCSR
jgi:hypothetical protein